MLWQEFRRRGRYFIGPLLGITFTAYFVYHTIEGDRGLLAAREITQQLHAATEQLQTVQSERDALAHKVAGLNPNHVDPDLLDQQIRQQLELVSPGEIVVLPRKDSAKEPAGAAAQPPR